MDRRRHSSGDLSSLQHRRGSKVATTDQEPHGHDTAEPHPRKIHRRHLGRRDPLLLSVRRAPLERPTDPAPCRSRSMPSRPPPTHTPWNGPARHHLTTLPGPRPANCDTICVDTADTKSAGTGHPRTAGQLRRLRQCSINRQPDCHQSSLHAPKLCDNLAQDDII
jgi:hypothetical protein